MTSELGEKTREKYLKMIPLKRFGTSRRSGTGVLFFTMTGHGYITGQTVQLDGGLGNVTEVIFFELVLVLDT